MYTNKKEEKNQFIPTDDKSEASSQELEALKMSKQINKRPIKESRKEIIKKTLSYNLPKSLIEYLHSYENVDDQLKQKTKGKHLTRDWKGPTANITLKKYLVDKIAKCYWATPSDDESDNYYHENDYMWSDEEFTKLWGSDSISKNLLLDFTDENRGNTIPFLTDLNNLPWWLDLLEKPSEYYYREFNNFSNTYLCTTQTANIHSQKTKNFASRSLQPSTQLPENYRIPTDQAILGNSALPTGIQQSPEETSKSLKLLLYLK
ncbi:6123_t:CDS:2 [Dentiscutata erythropus]|uniref:6123_t:CDS:1 n=1 Tax=Dentiscutata erythropus TaxID=1348616 RepID=A0A9N8YSJ5_9GLOM|nr:6123_t:CDS:2 [Dentiscutata erythropus]